MRWWYITQPVPNEGRCIGAAIQAKTKKRARFTEGQQEREIENVQSAPVWCMMQGRLWAKISPLPAWLPPHDAVEQLTQRQGRNRDKGGYDAGLKLESGTGGKRRSVRIVISVTTVTTRTAAVAPKTTKRCGMHWCPFVDQA